MTCDEKNNFCELPYPTSADPTIDIGHGNGSESGVPYVAKGQVLFAFDLAGLPARSQVSYVHGHLNMDITQYGGDNVTYDEVLCFLDAKVCSGEVNSCRNETFFKSNEIINDFFSTQVLSPVTGHVMVDQDLGNFSGSPVQNNSLTAKCSTTPDLYSANVSLGLKSLLQTSGIDPLDIIYNAPVSNGVPSLHVVVANNTEISCGATLVLELQVTSCTTMTPPPCMTKPIVSSGTKL